jgi:hypothetical protein
MLKRFFQPRPARIAGEALYAAAAAQARTPGFYRELGVEDTREGRFELYTLHVILLMDRLRGQGPAADETSQALSERYVRGLDDAFRELGIGDVGLAKRMKELMERIRDQMEKLPQEHLNMEGLDQDKASENLEEMAGALEQMEKLLNEGKIDEALAALDRMGKEMDSLEKEMGDPLAGASSDELSELDKTMGEATKELDKVEAQQQAIAEETAKLMEEMRAETAKKMAGEIADKLASAKAEVAEAKRALDAVDDSALRSSLKAEMEGMEASLQKVQSALDNADIKQAAEAAAPPSLWRGLRPAPKAAAIVDATAPR